MSKLVAYLLYGQDNDTYMFDELVSSDRCLVCGCKTNFLQYNPDYKPKRRMRDFSATYDGFWIASAKLRNCIKEKCDGVAFEEFSSTKDFFNLRPERVIEF